MAREVRVLIVADTKQFNDQLAAREELAKRRGQSPELLDPAATAERAQRQAALDLALKSGVLTPELKAALDLSGRSGKKTASGLDFSGLAGAGKKGSGKTAATPVDLLFFAQSREFDRGANDRAI